MSAVALFGFKEEDRAVVLTIKGRAVNPSYSALNFRVRNLLSKLRYQERPENSVDCQN